MSREIIPLPPLESARGYSPQHAAMYLDCSLPTVSLLIKGNRLPSRTLGKRRIIPGSELIRFLTGQEPVLTGDPISRVCPPWAAQAARRAVWRRHGSHSAAHCRRRRSGLEGRRYRDWHPGAASSSSPPPGNHTLQRVRR
jgi:excisionase family DNA binding protein